MRINKEDYQTIAELIRGFLEEIEFVPFDELPTCKELEIKLKKAEFGKTAVLSQQLDCEKENECAVFAFYDPKRTIDEILGSVMEKPLEEGYPLSVHIVILTASIEELLELEKQKTVITQIGRKWTAKRKSEGKKSSIHVYPMHAPRKKEKCFSVGINSRICALHNASAHILDSQKKIVIESDIFIANLYDIVELYNKTGAELFDRNVRYHIKDVYNVESEIRKTLLHNPAEFFDFNNGISMQVSNAAKLDWRNERDIRMIYEAKGDISVINGAQTISAAAEFFFQPLKDSEQSKGIKEAIERAKKDAHVLLRVIYPKQGSSKDCIEAFEQISISLNRQKPINPMDVQYACKEIMQINSLYDQNRGDPFYFRILKRGQVEPGRYQYQLSEFGRLVWAYFNDEPGKARSASTQDIICHVERDDNCQNKKTIYAPFEADKNNTEVFMKWYRPVNFANKLAKIYSAVDKEYKKQEDADENVKTVLANGRYFFVAYVVRMLNPLWNADEEMLDFSEFPYHEDSAKAITPDLVLQFAKIVASCAGKDLLNSNRFKTQEFYNSWDSDVGVELAKWAENLYYIINDRALTSPVM